MFQLFDKKSECPCCMVKINNSNLGKIQRVESDKIIKFYLICKSCSEIKPQSDITNSIFFREFWMIKGKSKLFFTKHNE